MKAFVTVVRGSASEPKYVLDPLQPVRIGRGNGCQIFLSDPLSSRTHVILSFESGRWIASDADSRNGTLVNDRRISQVNLQDGDRIQVGSTELLFQLAIDSDLQDATKNPSQTLVFEAPMSVELSGISAISQLYDRHRNRDLLDLYQLSMRLLSCKSPQEVASFGMDILRVRTGASQVGFLWIDEQGRLKPLQSPTNGQEERLRINRKLTDLVVKNSRAIWVKNDHAKSDTGKSDFEDSICVPLLNDSSVHGAIHLYREKGVFEEADFEFAISAAGILAIAMQTSRAQATLHAQRDRLVARNADVSELIGDCTQMRVLKDRIQRVSQASGCVLIRGESGVGKELVARAVHQSSPRNDRPLLCVNCAAIPPELMESQLFGHRKGAFTGAEKDHQGWFQQAHTGTLFLDEVGELTLDGQAKLLRILEGHPFLPVGATQEIRVDVRVIAATNRDLQEYVRDKRFREDLYYRLSVFELLVPPLRDRGEDIPILIDHFLHHFRTQHGRQHLELAHDTRQMLIDYRWPGNVRQLRNVIDSAVVLAAGDQIESGDLALRDVGGDHMDSLRIDVWEQRLIKEALKRTEDNVPEAAKLLGLSRATLYRKLEEYKIAR